MSTMVSRDAAAVARPLYSQVRDLLLTRIKSGEWGTGEALPNEYVLASHFGVSIGTVRRAIEGLEDLGIVVRKQGRGTFISGPGPQALEQKFAPLRGRDGVRAELAYQLLAIRQRPCHDGEQTLLAVPRQAPVIEVAQLIEIDHRVVGHELSVLSADRFPRLDTQLTYGQHLYNILADYGVIVTKTDDAIGIATADLEFASLLQVEAGSAVLEIRRTAFTFDRQPVEVRRSLLVMSRLAYHASIC